MAKSPLVIKDHQQAISSTRKEHLDQENHKILAGKGFVLKKYKTEKQRLEEHMTINDNIFTSINHVSNGDYGFNKLRALYEESKDNPLKSSLINQPTMRFTPKNALERIYESLSLYSPRKAGKEEILRQKKVVQIKKSSNDDGSQDEDEEKYPANLENPKTTENDYSESINNKTRKRNEKQLNKYEDKRVRIKHDQNSQARHLLSDLHERTHFKGASGFTLWKNTSLLKNDVSKPASKGHDMRHKENSKEIFLPKTSDRNGINSVNFNTTNNYLNNTQSSKFDKHAAFENSTHSASYNPNRLNNFKANNINKESSYRFEDYLNNTNDEYNNNYLLYKLDIEEDLAKSNPLLFNLTLNNFKKKFEDRHGADENKIDYIKKIAFQNRDGTKMAKSDELRKTDSYLSSLFERDYKKKFSLLQKDPVTFFEKFKDELEWAEFSKRNNLESI